MKTPRITEKDLKAQKSIIDSLRRKSIRSDLSIRTAPLALAALNTECLCEEIKLALMMSLTPKGQTSKDWETYRAEVNIAMIHSFVLMDSLQNIYSLTWNFQRPQSSDLLPTLKALLQFNKRQNEKRNSK